MCRIQRYGCILVRCTARVAFKHSTRGVFKANIWAADVVVVALYLRESHRTGKSSSQHMFLGSQLRLTLCLLLCVGGCLFSC